MRKLIAIIYTAMIGLLITGCGADSAMRKGDKFYALGEYYDAADQYKKAYSQTKSKDKPLRGQRALKLADCYRRINYTQKAIGAYQNAVRFKQADSTAMLHLGRLQLKNGSYKEAEKTFKALEDSMPRNTLVKNGLQSAQMAPKWKAEAQYSGYTVKTQAPSSNSVFRSVSIASGFDHFPLSSFCEKKISAFFVPVMPLSSSPFA